MSQQVRVRFAPSPTGHLHIGGLRTTIFNWLYARHTNGIFLIRIEDTDLERSKPEYTQSILDSFAWINIQSDEPLVIQSQRIERHRQVAQALLDENKAYRCFCTQEEVIERHKKKFGAGDLFVKYDGKCREIIPTQDDLLQPYVIRFKLPFAVGQIAWDDLIRGTVSFGVEQLDDFIIVRSDGTPMYNFVVVVDDADMHITHVIRGEDHVSNTPKQILLYQACNFVVPQFAHLSMILGQSGERLSKRDGAVSVLEYKQNGYLPDALFNYLVRLGWAHGDQEVFSRDELVTLFSLEAVNKKAAIFDQTKLDWLNGVYIRQLDPQELLRRIVADIMPDFTSRVRSWSEHEIKLALLLYKERVKTLKELADELILLHEPQVSYNHADLAAWITSTTSHNLAQLIQTLEATDSFAVDLISEKVKQLAKTLSIKLVELAQPIRIALVGKSSSPGVFELMNILGKQETVRRLKAFVNFLQSV